MKKRRSRKLLVTVLILLIAAAVFTVSCLLNPAWLFRTGGSWSGDFTVEDNFNRDRINIALLGFDRTEDRDKIYRIYRPDTIMVASFNFRTGEVAMVNIPRDSYVKIAGLDISDKINHAYMYGHDLPGVEDPHQSGIDTTLRTIQDFLGGVPLHYYISLDMDAVVEIVDRVGGIYYDVEQPVRADFGQGQLLVGEGYQLLNGQNFLDYVRYRGHGGDTGRSGRQQQILIAAFSQLKQQNRLKDIPELYRSLKQNLETNLSHAQIGALAVFGARVDSNSIGTYIFPGSVQFAPQGGLDISYIVINEAARVELIREIFGVTVSDRPQVTLPGRRAAQEAPEIPVDNPDTEPEVPAPMPGEGKEPPAGEEPGAGKPEPEEPGEEPDSADGPDPGETDPEEEPD